MSGTVGSNPTLSEVFEMKEDWVKSNANIFWESSFNHYLKPRLSRVYATERGLKRIRKWLMNRDFVITMRASDFEHMDPAHLLLAADGFDMIIGGTLESNIHVTGTKNALIVAGADFCELLKSLLLERIEIKIQKASIKDLFHIIRLLYF